LLFILFFFVLSTTGQALAIKRVALVIGNSAYQRVPILANPANDSGAIALLFKRAGFDFVETEENLSISDMRRVVRDFSDKTQDADIAVIYYAGHGLEVGEINYLVPIDASLRRDIDVVDEAVSLDRLLQVMEPARNLRLVILDACRDNPFTKSMTRTMASRTINRGLARVEPATSDTLVAFAVKAGLTAADGDGAHSPFTTALLRHLATPGLDVRLALGRVRDEVLHNTGNVQEPFVYGSLGGATVSLVSLKDDGPALPSNADPDAPASRDYEAAAKVGTKEAWDVFIAKYPTGFYADLARERRRKLSSLAPSNLESTGPMSAPKQTKRPLNKRKEAGRTPKEWEVSNCTNAWRIHRGDPVFERVLREHGCAKYE